MSPFFRELIERYKRKNDKVDIGEILEILFEWHENDEEYLKVVQTVLTELSELNDFVMLRRAESLLSYEEDFVIANYMRDKGILEEGIYFAEWLHKNRCTVLETLNKLFPPVNES